MHLLCNEDDSLVANVSDAYVRKPKAEPLYYLKWIHWLQSCDNIW